MGTVIIAVGKWFSDLPIIVLVVLGLVTATAIIWLINGIQWRMAQHPPRAGTTNPTPDHSAWLQHLDCFVTTDINYMDFKGLWNTANQANAEPFIEFNFVVHNDTPFKLTITGCNGQASIDHNPCTSSAIWKSGVVPVGAWSINTPTVRQPLQTEKGRELLQKIQNGEQAQFTFDELHYVWSMEEVDAGSLPTQVSRSFVVVLSDLNAESTQVNKQAQFLKRP